MNTNNTDDYYNLKILEQNLIKEIKALQEGKFPTKIKAKYNILKFIGLLTSFLTVFATIITMFLNPALITLGIGLISLSLSLLLVFPEKTIGKFLLVPLAKKLSKKKEHLYQDQLKMVRSRLQFLTNRSVRKHDVKTIITYYNIDRSSKINAEKLALTKKYQLLKKLQELPRETKFKEKYVSETPYYRVRK